MKPKNILNLMVLGSVLTITAAGCRTHPENTRTLLGDRQPISDPGNNPGQIQPAPPFTQDSGVGSRQPFGTPTPPNQLPGHQGWAENAEALKSDTVYFDFDKSAIKASESSKLDQVASYLSANGAAAIRIEGNCDERGTEEYNKSLGERRALAGREYLIEKGISADRVDTLTRGEDNPADTGHNEAAWKKNRRDEFIVLTAPRVQ